MIKLFTTIAFICVAGFIQAQNDSIISHGYGLTDYADSLLTFISADMGIGYAVTDSTEIVDWEKKGIEIKGDTLQCIRILIDNFKKQEHDAGEREIKLWQIMIAAIDWYNTVPDYCKANKQCKKLERLINKQGFKSYTKK